MTNKDNPEAAAQYAQLEKILTGGSSNDGQ
jgi:hypothetical protein